MKKVHPYSKLFLLTGDDWIANFHKWKDYHNYPSSPENLLSKNKGAHIHLSSLGVLHEEDEPPDIWL